MAHLTNYTYGKLCSSLDINLDIVVEVFVEYIYEDIEIFSIFNKLELKYLFNYKNILRDEHSYASNFYKEIPERPDNKLYVFEKGGKAKYHLSNECALLRRDFVDFHIPDEIKLLGDGVIEEYRGWFKENFFAERYNRHEITPSQIVFAYNSKFGSKYNVPILREDYKLVETLPNSNNQVSEKEYDFENLTYRMSHLKQKYANVFSGKVLRILSKHDYLLSKTDQEIERKLSELFTDEFTKNYGLENVKEKFEIAKSIKKDILKNLIEYFKWTHGLKEKDFDLIVLERFGLECCNYCKQNSK